MGARETIKSFMFRLFVEEVLDALVEAFNAIEEDKDYILSDIGRDVGWITTKYDPETGYYTKRDPDGLSYGAEFLAEFLKDENQGRLYKQLQKLLQDYIDETLKKVGF